MKKALFLFLLCGGLFAEENLVIIGGGPAGLTAALFAAQEGLKPFVVEGIGCQELAEVGKVIKNFPGFNEGILGKDLINQMREQAQKFGATLLEGNVISADLSSTPIRLTLANSDIIETKSVIIATGSIPRELGLPNEKALTGKGVMNVMQCQAVDVSGKKIVIVGGGDGALEEAVKVAKTASEVIIVNLTEALTASSNLKSQISENQKIKVFLDATLEDILDVKEGKVTSVVIKNVKTGQLQRQSADLVIVAIGYVPNTEIFKNQLEMQKSYITVKPGSTQTSLPGVFAVGNVMDPLYNKAITSSAFGCMGALDAKNFLQKNALK